MSGVEGTVNFLPTLRRQPSPTKLVGQEDGEDVYLWYITEDEYLRLNKIFGRDFQETGLGGTRVRGLPTPCQGCGKHTEFIDWVWTAIYRGVHSRSFMFKAIKESRQGIESSHDVYCSECGLLTTCRSENGAEGGAADIFRAGKLNRPRYPVVRSPSATDGEKERPPSKVAVWGKWWLDDNGSTAKYRAEQAAQNSIERGCTQDKESDGVRK
ncbi:hypothetical protein CPB86DRAFT_829832 [Serendipita vermifera]|nr:hypothetical protein CPB86DRAFT_829832 [Serendipita vermifera]